jgi:hypothetical protein
MKQKMTKWEIVGAILVGIGELAAGLMASIFIGRFVIHPDILLRKRPTPKRGRSLTFRFDC